jgi:hypothetical protein
VRSDLPVGCCAEVHEKTPANVSTCTGNDDELIVGHSVSPDVRDGRGSEVLSIYLAGVVWYRRTVGDERIDQAHIVEGKPESWRDRE